ncbi:hypothetical protein BV210_05190 [Halorientalis sp. IM1011]|uniref:hypothetical protein n=1 Tax=Halorientalis sp. IM1011 TaxID=1932360 RepID=UPI00097CD270|nr:hypothetical protein [Halorientalis sp. IM1011]AQL44480.1 hypothetical protein BV210_05190 [Halorientalis sp. IM1011]
MADVVAGLALALQLAILGTLGEAARRRNVAAIVNALFALAVTLLPALAAVIAPSITVDPTVPLWIALAGFLHSLGMLGLYETLWWWDHLTHTVSAALVAALLYAALLVAYPLSAGVLAVATVGFTFAVGVFWELIELVAREVGDRFDVEPVLVHYGWRDTAFDLVFDVVGALLIVGFEVGVFVPIVDRFPQVAETLVIGGGGVVLVGSLVMTVVVWPVAE